jgi:hypothetical protein
VRLCVCVCVCLCLCEGCVASGALTPTDLIYAKREPIYSAGKSSHDEKRNCVVRGPSLFACLFVCLLACVCVYKYLYIYIYMCVCVCVYVC